jgi:hypothetical protein
MKGSDQDQLDTVMLIGEIAVLRSRRPCRMQGRPRATLGCPRETDVIEVEPGGAGRFSTTLQDVLIRASLLGKRQEATSSTVAGQRPAVRGDLDPGARRSGLAGGSGARSIRVSRPAVK